MRGSFTLPDLCPGEIRLHPITALVTPSYIVFPIFITLLSSKPCHCEERSDAAISK